jgi:WD40 repeat protein
MQCHVQEITTAVAVDSNGFYLMGGTKGGRLHAWEISSGNLVTTWQGHFKAITSIKFTPCGNFCVSSSEDGMVRVWDVVSIMSSGGAGAGGRGGTESAKKIISPFRYLCSICNVTFFLL